MSASTSCMNEDIKAKSISPSLLTREQYFLSLYAFIVYFSIETILFRQTIDDGNHEKISIFVQSFSLQLSNMVTCHKFVLMKECTTDTTTVSDGNAILELSYAAFISDEAIHTIVECCG